MTIHVIARSHIRRSLVWSGALAGLWAVAALTRPAATFHLAPFLVATAPPVLFALDGNSRPDWTAVLLLSAAGMALGLAATLVVSGFGAMQGPAFGGFSSPLVEAVVFTVVGSSVGIGFAWWRMR